MTNNLTAKEKAQAGLRMIEEAIKQIIRKDGPMQPAQVEEAISLRWKLSDAETPEGIGYLIMRKMADAGQLTKDPGYHPTYSVSPGSTH